MRVLFTTLRSAGHFFPLVPFIDACRRHGHEVAVAAPEELGERVTRTGAAFFPFGHPGDEGLRPIWARMWEAPARNDFAVREIFAGACAEAALPALIETMGRWGPSIVVRESQEYAAVVAAEKVGVPHVRVAVMASAVERGAISAAVAAVDAHARRWGLSPDPSGERLLKEVALTFFPASLEGSGASAADVRRFRSAHAAATPPVDGWGSRSGPLVYVTFGTIAGGVNESRAAYRLALDAVSELPVRVLMTIGSELPLEVLGELPPNVRIERFVPQDDVMPHATVVLCHGGAGTTLGALAWGVPLVVTPMFADQPSNAESVDRLGAGIAVPIGTASADDLRRALVRVIEESSYREGAQRIAAEISALPPVDDAAVVLEGLARGPGRR